MHSRKTTTPRNKQKSSASTCGITTSSNTPPYRILLLDADRLRISEARNIILIGVGEATNGIINLLVHRDCRSRVRGIVNFIGENNLLRAVTTSIVDEYLSDWYFHHSKVFVGSEHPVWQRSKIRKKFGGLVKSQANNIHDILRVELDTVTGWIEEQLGR